MDGVEKEDLEGINKIIVPYASNSVLDKPLGDNRWTLFRMDSNF